ncbi:microtubule-associated protein tau-like isoform X1 [Gigaspora margarita]|uniref:Microtubule-associated protein n=1 Tax=Gigaspora margarita TaxID=4874 RepID=A0A8H4APS1_GIGMA|nr:microtubule-associated protein tau-like isoform X1 [Gigaspora margarita]
MATTQSQVASQLPILKKLSSIQPKSTTNYSINSNNSNGKQLLTDNDNESKPFIQTTKKDFVISSPTSPISPISPISPSIPKPNFNKFSLTNGLPKAPRPQLSRSNSDTLSQSSSNSSGGRKKSRVSPHIIPTKKHDFSHVRSRVGSLDNITHIPKESEVKIFTDKPDFSSISSRIGSLDNIDHIPKGGDKKILSIKLDYSNVNPKIGSLENIYHVPKGGDKKIESIKLDYSNVTPRIGSLDNINHIPKGGDKKIESIKPDFSNVTSRIGSLDNINHIPKGGDKKIQTVKIDFSKVHSRVGSLENISHIPQGGNVKIFSRKPSFDHVQPRVGSLDNIDHVPGGGEKYIPIKIPPKIPLSAVKSKVGSLNNIHHTPGGGDIKIYSRKLSYRDVTPRIKSRSNSIDSTIEERPDLVYSPVSSLAFDESLEVNSPPSEPLTDTNIPLTEVLPPIIENTNIEETNDDDDDYNDEPGYHQTSDFSKNLNEQIIENQEFDEGEPVEILQQSQLNDTDLDFKVNVQRKTLLLAEEIKSPRVLSIVEIPPDNSDLPTKPELTHDQKKDYDASWL